MNAPGLGTVTVFVYNGSGSMTSGTVHVVATY